MSVRVVREGRRDARRAGVVFAVLGLACFWYSLLQAIVAPVLHDVQDVLDTSASTAAWLVSGFMLSTVVAIPVLGRLGDMFGKRRFLILCLAPLLLAGLAVSSAAGSIEWMIGGRVLQGLGGAVFPLSFGIARDVFRPERVAGAVALLSGTVGFGGAGGVVAAGLVADHLSLRWLFILPAAGVAVTLVGVVLFVPESRVRTRGKVDVVGAVVLSVVLLAFLVAVTEGSSWGWASPGVTGLLLLAAVLGTGWVAYERRIAAPLVEMRMLRMRAVWTANVAALTFGFGMYATFLLIPLLVQQPDSTGYGLGQTATRAVLYLLPSQALMLLMSPLSGWSAGRIGARVPLAVGAACGTAGFVLLALRHGAPAELFAGSILMGLGLGLGWPAMANAIVAAVPLEQTGVATGMNTIARTIGGAMGTQVAATAVAASAGGSGLPAESGFVIGFVLSAVALLSTLLVSLLMPALRAHRLVPAET